ncbi:MULTISPECIES: rod shape-determining protein MreD [Lactobacillus]|uniref:Rod shape-determining protein MreD n=1 Tax=Lactobacillus xujianguonis TaxID=2495899 RepID=A0A437STX0_9LACO|nr:MULTISPECIES: rod shape-determining protein MreD [Lactobacillus]RVU70314.1 rod shape-determining protein MreD [Lactobacillus xujianguonis]RVU73870.1 rod shape-determining protein MreD [Lactobacillus xujianguonis]
MRILREWVLAIALYVAIILDGSFSLYLHQFMSFHNYGAACMIMPIGIILIGLFDDTNANEIWLALGTGVVADIFTLGIIGVYTVALPLLCWGSQRVARFLPETFWARLIVVLLGVSLLDIYSWIILSMVGIINVSGHVLLFSVLINLIWSLVFYVLTYWIWGGLTVNYPFLVDLDAYRQ